MPLIYLFLSDRLRQVFLYFSPYFFSPILADGHWFHKNEKADLKEDHPFFYKVTAFKNGQMVEQSGVWAAGQRLLIIL